MVKTNTDKQVVESSTSTSTSNSNSNSNSRENNNKFKGVRKRKWGKYVSEIRLPNSRERIWLGSYDTPEKAARAFDAALYCLRGKQAKFNFPDNPPDIQGGTSLKPQEIQVVAAKFANEYIVSSSSSSQQNEQEENHLTNLVPSNYSSPPTNSEGTVDLMSIDWPSLDFSMMTGSESSTPDFGAFGGLDDFPGTFLAPEFDVFYDEDEYNGGDYSQTTSLWNFNF